MGIVARGNERRKRISNTHRRIDENAVFQQVSRVGSRGVLPYARSVNAQSADLVHVAIDGPRADLTRPRREIEAQRSSPYKHNHGAETFGDYGVSEEKNVARSEGDPSLKTFFANHRAHEPTSSRHAST